MRPSRDETFLEIAKVLAKRATCKKKQVGCVIVDRDYRVLSTGYNGSPKDKPHCIDVPCEAYLNPKYSCLAIHAEMNALLFCPDISKIHVVYITEAACNKCHMLIQQTSAYKIVTPLGTEFL